MNLTPQLDALPEDEIAGCVNEILHMQEHGIRPKYSYIHTIANKLYFGTDHFITMNNLLAIVERYALTKAARLWVESRKT